MKKLIFLLIALFSYFTVLSQEEHFTFRDIPITGTTSEFGAKLVDIGYSKTEVDYVYKGKFIGESCSIFLLSSEYTNSMTSVAVQLDPIENWTLLKSKYNDIKNIYLEKYGKPTKTNYKFQSPYYDGDGYELSAIKRDKVSYTTLWEMDNGSIMITIMTDCSILIYYTDKINERLSDSAKKDSAINEI